MSFNFDGLLQFPGSLRHHHPAICLIMKNDESIFQITQQSNVIGSQCKMCQHRVKLSVERKIHIFHRVKIICYGVDPNLELLENFIKIEIISSLELLPLLLFFDACQRIVKQLNSLLFILGYIY